MARIYYVGDWAIQIGPVYAETSFNHAPKGLEVIDYGRWLAEALRADGAHEVINVPTWDFYRLPPGEYEAILERSDIIVFSDVEARNFQLHPQFFDHRGFGSRIITFPDRVRLTVDAIHGGTHAIFLGGWLSFTGELGKGGWGRTGLAEVLPCTCLDHEDLRESTEGFRAEAVEPSHPVLAGIDLDGMPPVLGFNRVLPRAGCPVLAHWAGESAPALCAGAFGAGRVLAYTSDSAPHWGLNVVFWQQYRRLWRNAVDWLCGETA